MRGSGGCVTLIIIQLPACRTAPIISSFICPRLHLSEVYQAFSNTPGVSLQFRPCGAIACGNMPAFLPGLAQYNSPVLFRLKLRKSVYPACVRPIPLKKRCAGHTSAPLQDPLRCGHSVRPLPIIQKSIIVPLLLPFCFFPQFCRYPFPIPFL